MLTPAFEITQSSNFVIIVIQAPFAKVSDTEIFIEDTEFRFHSKPYFLRLNLPGGIVENGTETAKYDSDTGSFTVTVPKLTPGENFEGLNLLTKLLTPKPKTDWKQPSIEVLDSKEESTAHNDSSEECGALRNQEEEEEFDWQIEQTPYEEEAISLDAPKYGFANQRSGVFKRIQEEIYDIVDLKDPDNVPISKRKQLREEAENGKFDPEYYLGDLLEDCAMKDVMQYKPPWLNNKEIEYTDEEKEIMRKLPRKEYILDSNTEQSVYLSLVDILCAYAYDHRTTEGEKNVESAWTICKLSSTLSWLQVFYNLNEVVQGFMRRSLCYPLYRNWNLSRAIISDAACILSLGKEYILQILLSIQVTLRESYPRYILNDLYITDYCVWIQSASDSKLKSFSEGLESILLSKADIDLDLCTLEQMAVDEEIDSALSSNVAAVSIQTAEDDSDDESDSDSDETSSESDDSNSENDHTNTKITYETLSNDHDSESEDIDRSGDTCITAEHDEKKIPDDDTLSKDMLLNDAS